MPPKKKQVQKREPIKSKFRDEKSTASKKKTSVSSVKGAATGISTVRKKKEVQLEMKDHNKLRGDCKVEAKECKWTRKDQMALRIQAAYKGYRCRKLLLDLKKKRTEYDELMDRLQKEAYQKLYKLQLEEEKEQKARLENEKKKQQDFADKVRRILEAAFDGSVLEIKEILSQLSTQYSGEQLTLQEHKLVECTDCNCNTPLSEAAAGGNPETVRLLLNLGANPNCKGQYGRTPLYRAAFAGHLEAVKVLLELGADPRIYADDGAIPQQVSANEVLVDLFQHWDIQDTDHMLKKLEDRFTERLQMEKRFQAKEENLIQARLDNAEKEYSSKQKQLSKAYEELNKRIHEHDEHGHIKGEITLQAVHDAEDSLEIKKLQAEEARKKLQKVQLELRIMRSKSSNADAEVEEEDVDVIINIRELDDVLMKDVGNKIQESGKWPLLIDPGEQVATYLRYRDTNYLNVCNPRHMEPESIRMAILGAIRYGKCAVLDFLDVEDMWPVVMHKFDNVQKDLLPELMSKRLLKEEKYLTLAKISDGEEYSAKMFYGARIHNFKFVILTQLLTPPKELKMMCYVIKVHPLTV